MRNIKNIRIVRRIFKPYMDWKRKRAHELYLRSPDSYYLKTLKGIHAGERCFVIGNGPSLRAEDLDKLKNEYTFAANRIFKIFEHTDWRPTYYLSTDQLVLRSIYKDLPSYGMEHMFLAVDKKVKIVSATNKITRIYYDKLCFDVDFHCWNDVHAYVSEDVSDHFGMGHTVTFNAIQLALYMGFTEIYLLGIDHSYSIVRDADGKIHEDKTVKDYFDDRRYTDRTDFSYNNVTHAYEVAREYCDNHRIKIFNATRGGKLEVFERVDFDSIFDVENHAV